MSAERIHRELRDGFEFGDSYQSVKRFATQIRQSQPQPVSRLESASGEEAQIHFGEGPMVQDAQGKKPSPDSSKASICAFRKPKATTCHTHIS